LFVELLILHQNGGDVPIPNFSGGDFERWLTPLLKKIKFKKFKKILHSI
jgi:hypothetical protein